MASLVLSGDTSGTVTLAAPAIAGTQSYTLPTAVPAANGYALTSTTAGVMSWASVAASPGGSTTQVQYNNAGAFGGISGFTTDGTRVTASTTIGVGGATPSTSGSGITFPATQSASTDVNTLDDYEEGTWTPSIAGTTSAGTASYTVRQGNYNKIGNVVYFSLYIDYGSGTGTGNTKITGLPFSTASTNTVLNSCSAIPRSLSYTGSQIIAYTSTSSSEISVAQANTANFGEFALPYDAGAAFAIAGFYQV